MLVRLGRNRRRCESGAGRSNCLFIVGADLSAMGRAAAPEKGLLCSPSRINPLLPDCGAYSVIVFVKAPRFTLQLVDKGFDLTLHLPVPVSYTHLTLPTN